VQQKDAEIGSNLAVRILALSQKNEISQKLNCTNGCALVLDLREGALPPLTAIE